MLLLFISVFFVICQGSVEITTEKNNYNGNENVFVQVVISNTDPSEPMNLLNWFANGEEKHIFTIYDSNNNRIPYVGPCFKRAKPTSLQSYTNIEPGASVSYNISLNDYYSFNSTQQYRITYTVTSWDLYYQKNVSTLVSNTLSVFIEGRLFVGRKSFLQGKRVVSGSNNFNVNCNASAQLAITNSRIYADVLMTQGCSSARYYLQQGVADARYTTWFGAFSSPNYNTVLNNVQNTANAIQVLSMGFDCADPMCSPSVYAFVYPNDPTHTMYLCGLYFSSPTTGTDSQGGTLIHETTHWSDVVGTNDFAYGQANCQALAISNVTQAINNADSYLYFAENNPVLGTSTCAPPTSAPPTSAPPTSAPIIVSSEDNTLWIFVGVFSGVFGIIVLLIIIPVIYSRMHPSPARGKQGYTRLRSKYLNRV